MIKPLTVKVGQIWTYDFSIEGTFCNWELTEINGNKVNCLSIESNHISYPVGHSHIEYTESLLLRHRWQCVSNDRIISKRKRPQLFIVVCRSCGSKDKWIKGTSKKNYMCLSCRGSFNV